MPYPRSEITKLTRLIQAKQNVDEQLWQLYLHNERPACDDHSQIFTSSDASFVVTALCSLLTCSYKYDLKVILEAVKTCGCSPKFAYAALTYYRVQVRPLSAHINFAFELLMMLDDHYVLRSPVNRLPQSLWFDADRGNALREKFPKIEWNVRTRTRIFTTIKEFMPLVSGSDGYTALHTLNTDLVKELCTQTKLPASYKFLGQMRLRNPRALTTLKTLKDPILIAHGSCLWFNHDDFLECPVSYKFTAQWLDIIPRVVEIFVKTKSVAIFEQIPHGVIVFYAFLTVTRPIKVPRLNTSDQDKVWTELYLHLFEVKMDTYAVRSSLNLLKPKARLVALDFLLRDSPNDQSLAAQFVSEYKEGLVDPEPVQALLMQKGFLSLAAKLGKSDAPIFGKELKSILKAMHDAPASGSHELLRQLLRGNYSNARVLEKLLPLINTLSIRGAGVMVKLEFMSLVLSAVLLVLYTRAGFSDGEAYARQTGAARAKGLDSKIWLAYFTEKEKVGFRDEVEFLRQYVDELCAFQTLDAEVLKCAKEVKRAVRQNVRLNTVNDTVMTFPDLGFKHFALDAPFNVSSIFESWRFLDMREKFDWKELRRGSQLVVDASPIISVLGTTPEPFFSLAADNLRTPVLKALASDAPIQNNSRVIRDGEIIIMMNFSNDRNSLILTRALKGSTISFHIPVNRPGFTQLEEQPSVKFDDIVNQLKNLIIHSTTLSRSQFSGMSDEWWREQKRIGGELEECLEGIQTKLFGGLMSIFSDISLLGTPTLADSRSQILKIYSRFLPGVSEATLDTIKDEMIELFLDIAKRKYTGAPLTSKIASTIVADVNEFVLDSLRLSGHEIDYDMVDLVELEHSLLTIVYSFEIAQADQQHVILIPGADLTDIPWESLPFFNEHLSMSRCLSFWHYRWLSEQKDCTKEEINNDTDADDTDADTDEDEPSDTLWNNVFYVIDPANDLPKVQSMFKDDFEAQWYGVCGKTPSEPQILSRLSSSSCYIYVGHGSGYKYLRGSSVRRLDNCSAVMLFGCSSARLKGENPAGPVIDYTLAGCQLFLGFMWDVPNVDCNIFTKEFLKLCFIEKHSVYSALKMARKACRIYTTGMAPVVYGIP